MNTKNEKRFFSRLRYVGEQFTVLKKSRGFEYSRVSGFEIRDSRLESARVVVEVEADTGSATRAQFRISWTEPSPRLGLGTPCSRAINAAGSRR
jgi:hypothetical protein